MKLLNKKRILQLYLLFCAAYIFILINLYTIQIKKYLFFTQLADQQHIITRQKHQIRGLIYDRNGVILADNNESLSAFITPNHLLQKNALKNFLKEKFPKAHERLLKNPHASFVYIKRALSDEQIAQLKAANILDIKFIKEPARFYPFACAAHLVGITDVDNNGLFGLELLYNDYLAGKPTTFLIQKDARTQHDLYMQRHIKEEGAAGKSLKTTIDADLQFLVFEQVKNTVEKFQAKEGAAIVMNPTTGEILAMVQYPTCKITNFEDIDIQTTKNKLVTESYELGSVMKVFVALACLQEGVVTPNELIDCENTKIAMINGFAISTWKEHGLIPFQLVIQQSNNIGIAKVAQRLGFKLYDHYVQLGFGKKTDLKWPGEQKGFITHPNQWSRRSIISLSFGYEIQASLLQLALAFSLIANNGCKVIPRLIYEENLENYNKQIYCQEAIEIIRSILEKTVTDGTARRAALKGYQVMAKTGTANMLVDGVYNKDHNTYTLASIIQKGDYKRVIVTFVKDSAYKNLYASSVAAPLAEQIAEHCIINDKSFK